LITHLPAAGRDSKDDYTDSFDTFDGTKPRFLNWGYERRSVSTLSIPRASDRGVEGLIFSTSSNLYNQAIIPVIRDFWAFSEISKKTLDKY
jgi:hypothetical protein